MKELFEFKPQNNDCDFKRIDRLQHKMQHRKANICAERAVFYTESFKQSEGEPYIIRKAKAFSHTLENMTIYIEDDSLIFGNMASKNFGAPIYPEYSIDWVINELDQFEQRSGDIFYIDEDTKNRLKEIAPYWHGHTHEDEVLANIPEINLLAEKQHVLHRGGISMSGDGHIVPKHEKILDIGFGGIIKEAEAELKRNDLSKENSDFYNAVIISMKGALNWIKRYACLAGKLAESADGQRRAELLKMASIASTLMEGKARSFYEAVEACYLVHILQMIESNGHSFCYGRFDQYIYPYYIADNSITKEKALEYITHFFIMNSSLNKVRPYGHTKFSQGYPLYSNLVVGGYRPDGADGTNELSYLCIEAMHLTSLAEPNFSMRYNKETPRSLLELAARLIQTGCGMPSMFNDEIVVEAMKGLDIPEYDALDYVPIGCVETGIPGKYGHRATGMTYVNWGKVLEILLNNGTDPKSGVQLVKLNGNPGTEIEFKDYAELWGKWKQLLKFYTNLAVACDHVCDESLAKYDADPFASSLVDNCMQKGKTLKNGGAKYDFVSQSNIGPCIVGNSLAVIKKLVFEEKKVTLDQLKSAMADNWQSKESRRIQTMCRNVPKFGNDDDYVDEIVKDVFDSYLQLLPDYETRCGEMGPELSGYTMSTSNITSYVPNGFDVGATPDGRSAGSPLNEGCSPTQGTDINGPTAVINSVAKLPNEKIAAGQLLNMRFSPQSLDGKGLDKFVSFLEASREKKIFHNQFNVIDVKTLRAAQKNPDDYTDLIVRVAGYCAQFISLMPEAQEAIIARTENQL